MFRKLFWITTLLIFLVACQSSQAPEPVIVREQTRVLDQAARAALLEVREDGTLVFKTSTALQSQAIDFKAGDVVVSEPSQAAPLGLLRKVVSISADPDDGGEIFVKTTQAQIGDAIQRGKLTFKQELTQADLISDLQSQGLVPSLDTQAEGIGFTFDLVVLDKDGNSSTTNDRVVASGEVRIKPVIEVDLDLDCGFLCISDNDIDFMAKVGVEETAKVKVEGKGLLGANFDKTLPIATLNFGPKVFFIGPVPVVVTPKIVLELKFDGSVGIQISYEVTQTLTAVAGAKYVDDWENISELSADYSVGATEAESGVSVVLNAKAKIALRGELFFYGVIGPTVEIAPYAKLDLMYPRDPFWKVFAGIEGNVGVRIDILGYSKHYQTNLWDDSIEVARSGNTAPSLNFSGLTDGSEVAINRCCELNVLVSDAEDGSSCCAVSFKSSVSTDGVGGVLGNASGSFASLDYIFTTLGSRTITATATDSKGILSTKKITLKVVNTPPVVLISSPYNGQQFYRGVTYTLRATSYDFNEETFQLEGSQMSWSSNVSGDGFPKTGSTISATFSSNGPRTLTLTGTDSHSGSSSKTVSVTVVDPPDNLPPVVNITQPQNGISIGPDTVIQLAGTATDPEGGSVTQSWDVTTGYNPETGAGSQIYTVTPSGSWKPSDTITSYNDSGSCTEIDDILRLRLKATDPQGIEGSDFIIINVQRFC